MSTGAGGTGGAKPCSSASECPGTDTECKKRACKAGACDFDFTAEDTMLAAQTAKDCSAALCDATSLRLTNAATVIDAVCYGYSAATKAALMGAGYTCEGTPADNLPHKDAAGAGDVDVSIQRLPGGALGNCIDTGDNAADFVTTKPALPQNTMSATTP